MQSLSRAPQCTAESDRSAEKIGALLLLLMALARMNPHFQRILSLLVLQARTPSTYGSRQIVIIAAFYRLDGLLLKFRFCQSYFLSASCIFALPSVFGARVLIASTGNRSVLAMMLVIRAATAPGPRGTMIGSSMVPMT